MKTAITAIAGLAIAGTASAQSITFDLSGLSIDAAVGASLTAAGPGAGFTVASVEWNIDYGPAAGSASWTEELAIELAAPGALLDGFGAGVGDGGADGNIHFGTTPTGAFNSARDINADVNLGGSDTTGDFLSTAGSTGLLNGASGNGTWTLAIGEIFDDFGADGAFGAGSFVRVNFVPAPGSLALLGLGGLAAARRRR